MRATVAKRPLHFVAYQLRFDEEFIERSADLDTHVKRLTLLKEFGFAVSKETQVVTDTAGVMQFCMHWQTHREMLGFEIDGAVMKVNSLAEQRGRSDSSRNRRWAIAYKFETAPGPHQAECDYASGWAHGHDNTCC